MRKTLSVVIATLLVPALATAMTSEFAFAATAPSPAAAAGPRATARAPAHAPAGAAGTEQFRIMSTVATSPKLSVIATGEFTAGGTDIPGKNADTAVFPGGTLRITHHGTAFTANLNTRTCLFTETQRGTYRLGHGTGRFARISGSGRFAVHILGVFARDSQGRCTHLAAPAPSSRSRPSPDRSARGKPGQVRRGSQGGPAGSQAGRHRLKSWKCECWAEPASR
jgi:hypothetical protein